ncbi:MAG: tRNA (adenosine(37)-N6)-threonylcarbamoyltransferase complex dimerization subunit type 1 TsaB [Acidobacteria bacterium]|nr:tRNA (adenosine(37)-N6)-threonylcarbamoyltransferase complex dimerization subunit type 1 TsaB [Acidobacteriota bacterium]
MYLLAVDTATHCGGAALGRNEEVVGQVMLKTPLEYSEKILPIIDFLLAQNKLSLPQINVFAVTTGPGSFTGLRIGLATVKAFAQALDRPVIGISTLEALAYRFRHVGRRIGPMLDARRQQIYAAVYRTDGLEIVCEQEDQVSPPMAWLSSIEDAPVFVGDGAQLYRQSILSVHPGARILETDNMVLEALTQLGYRRYAEGKTMSADQLRGNYVRAPDVRVAEHRGR